MSHMYMVRPNGTGSSPKYNAMRTIALHLEIQLVICLHVMRIEYDGLRFADGLPCQAKLPRLCHTDDVRGAKGPLQPAWRSERQGIALPEWQAVEDQACQDVEGEHKGRAIQNKGPSADKHDELRQQEYLVGPEINPRNRQVKDTFSGGG